MGVTVRVLAQHFENKAWYEGGQSWSPKGGHEFLFENVDSDTVLYAHDLDKVLKNLVMEQSNDMDRFEYRQHEVIFHEPEKLKSDLLEQAIIKQHDELSS